ncbi:hypothetical protein CO614_04265 [Lysobacteraceae bacterium NML120232]|nr:hypothetical protein CO608_03620 [Xanthomonadaceae bacterium NML08-0793]PJK12501.1 hypothetical protein CO614_04265 [Xanthomonadaceae bacterium NML120232]
MKTRTLLVIPALLAVAACTSSHSDADDAVASDASAAAMPALADAGALQPADEFLAHIAKHCGQAYEGRILVNEPKPAEPDAFEGKRLVMHVRGCDAPRERLEIPFHVGDDHSRTWILTRLPEGLRLKHDHRHQDGSPDEMTLYGGDSRDAGSAERQRFPVDAESIAMFEKGGLNASLENTWAMEIHPDTFIYELSRPNGRMFKVEFDLTRPVELPPTPWGW